MANTNDDAISTINGLIETCRDGQTGFQTASEGVSDSSVKTLFLQYSQQRAQYVGELQTAVRQLGGDPENTGSVAAALHRGWINIKSAVTGRDEHAILEECERGEDSAVHMYQDAMKENLPSQVSEVVERQYRGVKEAHDRVRNLRNMTSTATA